MELIAAMELDVACHANGLPEALEGALKRFDVAVHSHGDYSRREVWYCRTLCQNVWQTQNPQISLLSSAVAVLQLILGFGFMRPQY